MQKKVKRTIIIVFAISALVVAIWVIALIRCEILTHLHYDEFAEAYQQNTMLSDKMETFKILDYSDTSATVYYIGEGYCGADVLEFEWQDGVWNESDWRTIWSASGSASEVIWPYWWHFVYGGL